MQQMEKVAWKKKIILNDQKIYFCHEMKKIMGKILFM